VEHPNYIHNFYVFLLFKLGLVGMAAVVSAIVLWIQSPLSHLRTLPPGSPDRVFLAAVVAAWVSYAIWSLASPEILDFRMAPLWGFLVGASGAVIAQSAGGTGADRC
jgi:peptidoglycan biosynthesis protein MviN/MurJ (putative lipid II flippase)